VQDEGSRGEDAAEGVVGQAGAVPVGGDFGAVERDGADGGAGDELRAGRLEREVQLDQLHVGARGGKGGLPALGRIKDKWLRPGRPEDGAAGGDQCGQAGEHCRRPRGGHGRRGCGI
jgi:hypothetical protein